MKLLNAEEIAIFSGKVSEALIENKRWRAGQAMFNVLHQLHPELANSIRGTENDPFYRNDKINDFLKAICDEEGYANVRSKYKE